MERIKELLVQIRSYNDSRIFERLYVGFIVLVTSLFWILGEGKVVPAYMGLLLITVIASISLLVMNKFKYFIPCTLALIFANPDGYKSDEFPLSIVICGFLMIGILVAYTIINRDKISFKGKDKSFYAFIYLAVFSFVPLLYHNLIDSSVLTLVWIYFSYLLYLGIYLFFLGNMDNSSWEITKKSIQAMVFIICIQCIAKVCYLHAAEPNKPLVDFWYYLGWGLCNEAGIMICFGMPFVFLGLKKENKYYDFILFGLKLVLIAVGMLFTGSRGTYLFGVLELIALSVYTLIKHRDRKWIAVTLASVIALNLVIVHFTYGFPRLLDSILHGVFREGLDSNGRVQLYDTAVKFFSTSPLTFFFGNGWVAERARVMTQYGPQDGYWVYHSTFFETLCCFGLLGVFVMIYHFYEKYRQLRKVGKYDFWIILIGYIAVDLYGMIDNTYNFYYYMIPLVILMANLDARSLNKTTVKEIA